ncbi:GDSL-type esterase/lipase family protein [Sphingomonas sp. BT-65]|uniref:GDSL-type esterase/lipase family protein n=1 Tax=Sphingomonas sp. BT-65 TaxID=2989821 RepID=UPI002235BC16|nr:GDSL-type esterase/lipase family protein [Sphingomonas sp. BT-65]MCW4461186.1 GDSL-type esterase/lipase family protein [Sphingomonas sp. BT-65]
MIDRRALLVAIAACPIAAAARVPARSGPAPFTLWATATDRLDYAIADQTVRLALRATAGAPKVRLRISNAFGVEPLEIASLHLGLRQTDATVRPGTNLPLTLGGRRSILIPAGASVISDPAPLSVAAGSDLLASVAVRGRPAGVTGHLRPKDWSWLSAPGDFDAVEDAAAFPTRVPHWFFVDALVGEGASNAGTVAFLGDSITDSGSEPRGGYQGWVDSLARRVAATSGALPLGLANLGISGNRITAQRPGAGPNALARFDRDIAALPGVHTLVLFEGINDIYGTPIAAEALIQAHAQLALRARLRGLRVIGATLLPTRRQGFTAEREGVRAALNQFIRASPLYDAVIDFDRIGGDPADPLALRPAYDSGDRLHPGPVGYRAMAQAVPLDLLYPKRPRR